MSCNKLLLPGCRGQVRKGHYCITGKDGKHCKQGRVAPLGRTFSKHSSRSTGLKYKYRSPKKRSSSKKGGAVIRSRSRSRSPSPRYSVHVSSKSRSRSSPYSVRISPVGRKRRIAKKKRTPKRRTHKRRTLRVCTKLSSGGCWYRSPPRRPRKSKKSLNCGGWRKKSCRSYNYSWSRGNKLRRSSLRKSLKKRRSSHPYKPAGSF